MGEKEGRFDQTFYDAWWSSDDRQFPLLEKVINESYANPKDFWNELLKYHQEATGLICKSTPYKSFDFYHDCVKRHLGKRRIAFKTYEKQAPKEWSYEFLDRLVNYQVDRWKNYSFKPSQEIAIVMPVGIHLLIAMLTALRLGLKFTYIPTDSPVLSFKRVLEFVKKISPSFVVTTADISSVIPNKEKHWLLDFLEEKAESNYQSDYCYAPADVVQDVITCQSLEERVISPLSAQDMYLSALRDGFLSLGLKPGMCWAYSSRCSLREQPCNLLMALLCGATTIHIPEKELLATPGLIGAEPIDVLALSASLKNLWLDKPGFPRSKLKFWYRHLADLEDRSWKIFKEKHKIEKTPNSEFIFDNSQGGVILTSIPSFERVHIPVWPALGTPWKLLHPNQSGQDSLFPHGIFQQNPSHPSALHFSSSNLMLSHLAEGYALSGTLSPNKEGYTIPICEIENGAKALEFCKHVCLITLPKSHSILDLKLILLVFVSPFDREKLEKEKHNWKQKIHSQIAEEAGSFFVPDHVEFYSILPRMMSGKVDRNWCLDQYISGNLATKRDHKVYYWLNLLRTSIMEEIK